MTEGLAPPGPDGTFAEGTRIASYQLIELVGRGGMGSVYSAYDDRLYRQVALKILDPALAADEAFRQRFIRESRSAAAVDDPNIIPVYEAGESDGVLFIAMRLVRGGNLRTLVAKDGPMPPAKVEQIVSAVGSALDAAHAAGLVHRDVKPANILLEMRDGHADHVYLSDFGLSKAAMGASGLTGTGQFLGTADYVAPEQIQGLPTDGRADQYALGCTAFELLAGHPPFKREQGLASIYAHLSEPPPALSSVKPGLPAAADAVFAKVLAKSPDDRYGNCQQFASALRQALNEAPTAVNATPAPPAWPATPVVADAGPNGTNGEAGPDRESESPGLVALAAMLDRNGGVVGAEPPTNAVGSQIQEPQAAQVAGAASPGGQAMQGGDYPWQGDPAVQPDGQQWQPTQAAGQGQPDGQPWQGNPAGQQWQPTQAAGQGQPVAQPGGQPWPGGPVDQQWQPTQAAGPQVQAGGQGWPGGPAVQPGQGWPGGQPGQPWPGAQPDPGWQQGQQGQGWQAGQPWQGGQPGQGWQGGQPGQAGQPWAPGQNGAGGYGPAQPKSRRIPWPVIIGALVVLVVVAGGIVFLLKRHTATPPAKPVTVSHTFASRKFGTISVSKVWQLSSKSGSTLTATITVHNPTSRAVNAVFSEPIPVAVASNPQSPHYTPSPAHISTSTRVVEWKLSIPAGATSDLRYSVQIDKPASNSELNSLVAGFNAVASRENLSLIQASLKSLTLTPSKLKLKVGHAGHLRLRGTLSNGAPATTAMLSMAHWTTANAAIAKVSDGKVTAVGAGTTRITARIGSVKVSVLVTVAAPSAPAPTYTPPPATYSPPANTPTPQPSGTPTATI